jgi:hypothetical protein
MCKAIKWSFAAAYALALFLFAVGTWGGLAPNGIPLGMPWTLF